MKKFLFFALAAAFAFTSCTKDETLATAQPGAIDFAVAANNSTRSNYDPSITTGNIKNFAVYAHMRSTADGASGEVFNNEVVSGSNTTGWSYTNTQYWTKNIYYFAALAPSENRKWTATTVSGDKGIGKVSFENDGTQDLLYWADIVDNKDGHMADTETGTGVPVSIVFNHLLSKVKFSFANGLTNELTTIKVSDIKITNAYSKGGIDLDTEDWWEVEGSNCWKFEDKDVTTFEFGNATRTLGGAADTIKIGRELESDKELLLFPALDKTYKISFHVQVLNGEVIAIEADHEVELTYTFEMGYCYDLKATLTAANVTDEALVPIEFTVDVKPWVPEGGVEVEVPVTKYKNVEVGANQTYTLTDDGEVVGSIKVAGTLDGAGHTLYGQSVPTNNGMIRPTGTAVIKDLNIDGANGVTASGAGIRAFYINSGAENVTIENVVVTNVTYPINVGGEGAPAALTLTVKNSTLEGWTSYGATTTATFENVRFTCGDYARFRPYGETKLIGCDFADTFIIDLSLLAAGEKVTFVNCTYNGAALTADKVSTVDDSNTMAGTFEIVNQ